MDFDDYIFMEIISSLGGWRVPGVLIITLDSFE